MSFNSIEEFWILDKFIRKDMVENGMFFIMLEQLQAKNKFALINLPIMN